MPAITDSGVVAYLNLEDYEDYGDFYDDGTPISWSREVRKKVTIGLTPCAPGSLSYSVPISTQEARALRLLSDPDLSGALYTKLGVTSLRDSPGLPKGPYYDPIDFDAIWLFLHRIVVAQEGYQAGSSMLE